MYNEKRKGLYIGYLVIGITLIILSKVGVITANGVWLGVGGGLAVVGLARIIGGIRYSNNEEYRDKVDLAENDERNQFIRMKTWEITGKYSVISVAAASVIMMLLEKSEAQMVLTLVMCGILALYWAIYIVIKKKY